MIRTSQRPLISPTLAFYDEDYPELKAVERLLTRYGEPPQEERTTARTIARNDKLNKEKIAVLGEDIIRLRLQVQELQSEKEQMRKQLFDDEKTKDLLIRNVKLENIDKAELIDRYVTLKRQLSFQNAELQDYKDLVLKLKSEVIKRRENDQTISEKRSLLEQRMREALKKEKSLRSKCTEQETEINNLQKRLETETSKNDLDRGERNVLLDENQRLRDKVNELKRKQLQKVVDTTSMLSLHEKLEKANTTIKSLEEQLSRKGHQWTQEKSYLQTRLREYELGLFQSQTARSLDYYPRKTRRHRYDDDDETEGNSFLPPLPSTRNRHDSYAY